MEVEEIVPDQEHIIAYKKEYEPYVYDLLSYEYGFNWSEFQRPLLRKYKFAKTPRRIEINYIYRSLLRQGLIKENKALEEKIITKQGCAMSGVMAVTLSSAPLSSCAFDCSYCPTQGSHVPKSYLSDEPAIVRAIKYSYDPVKQLHARGSVMYYMEHTLDKIEVIIIGGTWSCYSTEYQETFMRDVFYGANTVYDFIDGHPLREKLSLYQEQEINETAHCRIISVTVETRPDMINRDEIIRLRTYGVTRIQIGIQHIDDEVLRLNHRGCTYDDTVRAIRILKDNGFKIDAHFMPNLFGSNPELDIEMFKKIISSPELQVDQWKIYPCEVVANTKIHEWYLDGTYIPYPETDLKRVIKYAMEHVPPYIRINRIIRDILMQDVIAGLESAALRDDMQKEMAIDRIESQDIRVREVKAKDFDSSNIELVTRQYFASDGIEYFLSHESKDRKTLYSLLRLRVNGIHNMCVFPELLNCTMIREVHVYGKMIHHSKTSTPVATQHRGLGMELVKAAEDLTRTMGYERIAVISGIGVYQYYANKLGFMKTVGGYMVKDI